MIQNQFGDPLLARAGNPLMNPFMMDPHMPMHINAMAPRVQPNNIGNDPMLENALFNNY